MINITQEQIMQNWGTDNSDAPLVSVRCITYNHEPYIAQALDGFLMQKTNFSFEVIVHDDASTDKTADIIREYEVKFPKIIKPIYETENQWSKHDGSLSQIVNAACKGKYIALCEGDDYWIDENKLQMQVDFLENNPAYGMSYTNFNIFNQKKHTFELNLLDSGKKVFTPEYNSLDEWVINKGYVGPMTWVFRKYLLEYNSLNSLDGTYVMFAHFLANGNVKCFKSKTTSVYRVLEESASHSYDLNNIYKRNLNLLETQEKLIDKYSLNERTRITCEKDFYKKQWKLFIVMHDIEAIDKSLKYQESIIIKMILRLGKNHFLSLLFKRIYTFLRKIL